MSITDLKSCIAHIQSANPRPNEIALSPMVFERIKEELRSITHVQESPRPTYGGRFGDIDRWLWHELQALKKFTIVEVLGVRLSKAVLAET